MEEGEQPCREEFLPENPATKALVEQWETLHVQDGVEDAVTHELLWLLINCLSL